MKNKTKNRWTLCVLLLVFLAGLALRMYGMERPERLHPDEATILRYMRLSIDRGWLPHTYAGGYFVIAEQVRRAAEVLLFHPAQRLRYLRGNINRMEPRLSVEAFARPFNVALGALTIFLVFGLCRAVTGSRAAGLFGAALLAFAPYAIEHSRYIETDGAALAMLILALWGWVSYTRRPCAGVFIAAALATGYAAGTKYTLAPLVPAAWLLAAAGGFAKLPPGTAARKLGRIAGRGAVALVLMLAGFLAATRAALEWSSFYPQLQRHGGVVFGETKGLLGEARHTPWAQQIMNGWAVWNDFDAYGIGWLTLALAGFILLFSHRWRRLAPITLFFPLLFLYSLVFKAPYVRSQESMILLPSMAVAAAAAAAALLQRARTRTRRAVAGLALAALLVPTVQLGVRAADRCGWSDTRWMARDWMARTLPADTPAGFEIYAHEAARELPMPVDNAGTFEEAGAEYYRNAGFEYLVRNESHFGRGVLDPRTGRPFPRFQEMYAGVLEASTLLRRWSVLDPHRPRITTFRSPAVSLWAFGAPPEGPEHILAPPRPVYISERGRETHVALGESLGAPEAIKVNRYPREIAVAAPADNQGPVFVLLHTEQRGARIRVHGFGRRHTVDLDAYDTVAIPLRRPWWAPRFTAYERIRIAARPQRHILEIPCWARVTSDPVAAAQWLFDRGRAGRAWALLNEHGAAQRDPGLAVASATAAGRAAEAAPYAQAAATQQAAIEALAQADDAPWRLNGLPFSEVRRLARIRLAVPPTPAWDLELRRRDDTEESREPIHIASQRWPIRTAQGLQLAFDAHAHRGTDTEDTGNDYVEIFRRGGHRATPGSLGRSTGIPSGAHLRTLCGHGPGKGGRDPLAESPARTHRGHAV